MNTRIEFAKFLTVVAAMAVFHHIVWVILN